MYLIVFRLLEVCIPETDSVKGIRRLEAYEAVSESGDCRSGLRRSNRNGDDDLAGRLGPQRGDGGAHRRASGQSVIDENDDVIVHD